MEKVSDWIFVWKSWGEPSLYKKVIFTLLRIMNIRFLAPPADSEILRFLIKCYFFTKLIVHNGSKAYLRNKTGILVLFNTTEPLKSNI